MTLDYVIDIAVATASDVVRDEHGHTVGYNYTEYPVIVDTGSSNLAMAVKGCSNCGVGASDLDAGLKSDMCIEVVYGSGSWSGYQTEALRVGFVEESASSSSSSGLTTAASPVVENTTLAGITDQDDFFMGGGYNGILGLAYPALSEPYSSTFCSSSSSSSSSSPSGVNGNGGGASSTSDGGDGSAHERVGDDFNEPTAIEDAATAAAALILDGAGPDSGGQGGALVTSDVKRAAATPLLDAMFSDGALSADVFTIGFCSNEAALAVGGVDPRGVVGGLDNITYVPAMKTYEMFWGYYLVYLESVEVDGEDIGADASTMNALGGVLVDSGTTLLYLPTSVVEVLEGKVAESVSLINGFFAWGACVSDDVLQAFPDISLNLKVKRASDELISLTSCQHSAQRATGPIAGSSEVCRSEEPRHPNEPLRVTTASSRPTSSPKGRVHARTHAARLHPPLRQLLLLGRRRVVGRHHRQRGAAEQARRLRPRTQRARLRLGRVWRGLRHWRRGRRDRAARQAIARGRLGRA